MRYQRFLQWLIPAIGLLALFAAGMGLFYGTPAAPYAYTNHRGETVVVNAEGLYYYDSVSMAAQQQGNDLVTLTVGLPLLAISTGLAFRGSMRGRLLLTGTLGFFLYTYLSMSMLTAFNALFLLYVALFSLSLHAFILSTLSFDLERLPRYFSARLPRGWISGLMFFVAGFLLLAWLGRILPPLLAGETPALENATTMVIQAMDLGLIVPLATLSGVLLLRGHPLGYLLASVTLLKGVTMGLAISSMVANMARRGVGEDPVIAVPFLIITLANLVMSVFLLKSVQDPLEGHASA